MLYVKVNNGVIYSIKVGDEDGVKRTAIFTKQIPKGVYKKISFSEAVDLFNDGHLSDFLVHCFSFKCFRNDVVQYTKKNQARLNDIGCSIIPLYSIKPLIAYYTNDYPIIKINGPSQYDVLRCIIRYTSREGSGQVRDITTSPLVEIVMHAWLGSNWNIDFLIEIMTLCGELYVYDFACFLGPILNKNQFWTVFGSWDFRSWLTVYTNFGIGADCVESLSSEQISLLSIIYTNTVFSNISSDVIAQTDLSTLIRIKLSLKQVLHVLDHHYGKGLTYSVFLEMLNKTCDGLDNARRRLASANYGVNMIGYTYISLLGVDNIMIYVLYKIPFITLDDDLMPVQFIPSSYNAMTWVITLLNSTFNADVVLMIAKFLAYFPNRKFHSNMNAWRVEDGKLSPTNYGPVILIKGP
jgi:hypothetical protein